MSIQCTRTCQYLRCAPISAHLLLQRSNVSFVDGHNHRPLHALNLRSPRLLLHPALLCGKRDDVRGCDSHVMMTTALTSCSSESRNVRKASLKST